MTAWVASAAEAPAVAALLHAFNEEFDSPTPGVAVLTARLRTLLAGDATYAVLAGTPDAVGLVSLRPTVWGDGPVALLDELYTRPTLRDRGLGAAVLAAAVAEAGKRGAVAFEIEVDEPDVDAHRFYARHGFPVADPVTGDRAFVLRRELR